MYDSVIIGTSPVSLLEAIHLAETGRRVRIIERESSLGGAWRLFDCLGLSAVEVSPHLLVADPVVHEVISNKFEIELEALFLKDSIDFMDCCGRQNSQCPGIV